MYLTSQTARTIAWSTLTLHVAGAQYIIDNLSFGHKEGPISPDYSGIPHWTASSGEYEIQVLSDRAILTPPWPGNRRGSLWAQDALRDVEDWTAELDFRATGMDRGAGNLQLWYTKTSQANDPPASLYTAPKFDGLVLVLDQYEGRGGSIRGFLNDGTIDIKAHPDPDTLAFGHCEYAYRNLGRLSTLKLHHARGMLEVKIDGNSCFKTDKVKLPDSYRFGISASSAENPDSFEVHRFFVSTTNSHWQDEHPSFQSSDQQQQQHGNTEHDPQHQQQQQHQEQQKQQQATADLNDVLASTIRSQQDQFADLHNRIQILNHRVNSIYDLVEKINKDNENRFNDLMSRVVPMDDRSGAIMRNVEKVERTTMEVLRDLESKDFKDMVRQVNSAIENSHNAMSQNMPLAMAHIVGSQKPSLTSFLFIAVAVQIMIVGAYMAYKKRRNSAPKKYL